MTDLEGGLTTGRLSTKSCQDVYKKNINARSGKVFCYTGDPRGRRCKPQVPVFANLYARAFHLTHLVRDGVKSILIVVGFLVGLLFLTGGLPGVVAIVNGRIR
jgi:hypothetical protein